MPAVIDSTLRAAVDVARAAAVELGGEYVGEHVGVTADEAHVVTHAFAATVPGYGGWHWAVTLARVSRSRNITVDEVVLLPGDGALVAPEWVPWADRVQPGDLSPGDLVPQQENDPRIVPAYVDTDDPDIEPVAFELGLGRPRVLSRDGRLDAAERWYEGDHGPDSDMARQAPATCGTCAFLVPLAGVLRAGFGVCANEITAADGAVVSVEYGCGAHSEVRVEVPKVVDPGATVFDDGPEVVEDPS